LEITIFWSAKVYIIIIHMHRLGLSILAVNWQRVRRIGVRALVDWKLHMKTNHLKVNTV